MLEPLVEGQHHERAILGAMAIEESPEAHPLAVAERQVRQGQAIFTLTLSFHFDSLPLLSFSIQLQEACQGLGGSSKAGLSKVDTEDLEPGLSVETWLGRLARGGEIGSLLAPSWSEQLARGYGHTLREIGQQPVTWMETATRVVGRLPLIQALLEDSGAGQVVQSRVER